MLNLCMGCPYHNDDNQLCSEYEDPTYSCPVGMVKNTIWGETGWELSRAETSKNEAMKISRLIEAWQDDSH